MKISRPGLTLLLLVQLALFWQFAQREIVWAYPADFDQSVYLSMDYSLYRDVLRDGLFPALDQYLHHLHPTGMMLPLQDCAAEFLAGPGRMPNLLLNFIYFALLEIVFFVTARWLTGRTVFGWIGVGLLMLLQSPFLSSGGLFDCRIDLIACCLYGTFVCLLVRSNGLREGRWLAAAVGCALLLMTFRTITLTYLIGFCMTLFTLLLGLRLLWRGRVRGAAVLARGMQRTVVLGLSVLAVGGAVIAFNWQTIHDYYIVGHLTGNEKHFRAVEAGVSGLPGHLTYYLSSLLHGHLGKTFVVTWLVLAAVGLAAWFGGRRRRGSPAPGGPVAHGGAWAVPLCVVAAGLFSPWFILTLDESKSPVVADVLDAPAALLLILLLAVLVGHPARVPGSAAAPVRRSNVWWIMAAVCVLALGSINWLTHLTRQGRFSARRASVEQIEALYDFLGDESRHMGFQRPRIASDMVSDWLVPATINVDRYEHRGQWLEAQTTLGGATPAVPHDEVFTRLAASDFVLLSTFRKEGPFPFYESIRPLAGELTDWCEAHLLHSRAFEIDGGRVTVYIRPNVALEGLSSEWLTPATVRVRLPGAVLDSLRAGSKHTLVLEGTDNPTWLPKAPTASVTLEGADGLPGSVVCPAEYARPKPGVYQIRVELDPLRAAVPVGADAVLDLRLEHSFFVPRDIGINDDSRQLIVTNPSAIRFE